MLDDHHRMVPAGRLRSVYFLFYAGVGAYLPFFAAYLRGLGFSGEQIGAIQMIPSLFSPVVALGWASWADRHGSPADGLRRAASVAALAAVALPFARTPPAVAAVLGLLSLGYPAIVPLLDTITVETARRAPGLSYAAVRLFGSLGFCAAALAVGRALAARGDARGDLLVPVVFAACVVGYAAFSWVLPRIPPPAHGTRPGLTDALALLRDRTLLLFLLACSVHWAATGPYHLFFGVLVRERGFPSDVAGLAMTAGVVAEIAALVLYPRLEHRFSPRRLLGVAFAGSALRWVLVGRAEGAMALVLLQLMHGLTFGLFWATAMGSLSVLVPSRLRATGQALFSAVVFGGANALAFLAAGRLYDHLGAAAPLFAWAGALELVALALTATLAGLGARRRAAGRERPG
jgi:PPP family 3-phenylpropionic acid transporter